MADDLITDLTDDDIQTTWTASTGPTTQGDDDATDAPDVTPAGDDDASDADEDTSDADDDTTDS